MTDTVNHITSQIDDVFLRVRDLAAYSTDHGCLFQGKSEELLSRPEFGALKGRVQLVFTSPPFALNNKKRYDNKQGEEYKSWLSGYARLFRDLIAENGSIVIELGNAWEPGLPVMSTLSLEALLEFKHAGDLYLCQQFVVNNPARLPSPAQWVTIQRKRVTDSFTHVWWMAKSTDPKADNKRVLKPYSPSMKKLLKRGSYNDGKRPSEHLIGQSTFLTDHGGAIPQNVLDLSGQDQITPPTLADEGLFLNDDEQGGQAATNMLSYSNTSASDPYMRYCRANGITLHPARMPIGLPTFFINFLTEPGDIVLDPFAGSNTTGAAAERLGRRWVGFEVMDDYVSGSRGRFTP